jgi:3-oxoacyl-[acyl-carrier protein] reductase
VDTGLKDKVAVVTGASSGIGRAVALAYAAEGAKVGLTYATGAERGQAVADEIVAAGGEAVAVPLDLASPASIVTAFDAISGRFGGVDVFVANAVALPRWRRFEETPVDDWLQDVAVNFEGTARGIAACLPLMRPRGAGRIVIVSSGSAIEGLPNGTAYLSAKTGLEGLGRSLAWELGPAGILVNVVAPGVTITRDADAAEQARRAALAARTPSQHLSGPDEVAKLIVWLGSFANANMTGEIVREGSSNGRSAHIG